jgi:hypothetical protein
MMKKVALKREERHNSLVVEGGLSRRSDVEYHRTRHTERCVHRSDYGWI